MEDKKTFYKRALLRFKTKSVHSYQHGMDWYRSTHSKVHEWNQDVVDWVTDHLRAIISIGVVVFIGITILLFIDLFKNQINESRQVGIEVIGIIPILVLIVGAVFAVLVYFSLWLMDRILLAMIYIVLFMPVFIGVIFYGSYLVLLVISQFLLLILLTILFFMNRLWLLWRRIFYTCPNRECSYRGLPVHVCAKCGENHEKLWPNKFGLFYHFCTCGKKLPTLDVMGRGKLTRLCATCKIRLSEDIGELPEELVALVGGPSVGKTNFLLMSTKRLMESKNEKGIQAEIVVPGQEQELNQGIADLEAGIPPEKTKVTHTLAYLLRVKRESRKSLLYYYDAAGEEFSSIKRSGCHKNVKHLDGLIFLVDPFCLEGLKYKAAIEESGLRPSQTPLDNVVSSTIATLHRIRFNGSQRNSLPLAVVITKADAKSVQEVLGDIKRQLPTSEQCEEALIKWGARNSLQLIRQHFKTLRFFACSSLGRTPREDDYRPFKEYGIEEPLQWILNV
jgi:hypothetical protein